MRRHASLLGAALLLGGCGAPGLEAPRPLIPVPQAVADGAGDFDLDATTGIALTDPDDAELRRVAELWAAPVREAWDFDLPVDPAGEIRVGLTGGMEPEAYRLTVSEDGVQITASDYAGVFYGLQTLSQLLPAERPLGPVRVAAVTIDDAPRFPYRGMHLDVARHFFGPDFVKEYIDHLARYKLNRFHWHLTEDQGWRIQIDQYPRLTEVSAWRAETQVERNSDPYVGDGERYGGFYTKEEIREIVAYAQERFITIVPEIEMPGHSVSVLAAYPELACTEGPFEVSTRWGVMDDIYCPKEETFEFLENVLTEVMELFPGEYIHIGGDEAPKTRWEESEIAQAVIQREGLADEHELQSWFIRRIEAFLNQNGRRLIGWDEILEGGLAPNATVMSWRGIQGGIEAAQQGHDVIMTPTSHMYFDYYQGDPEQEPLAIGGYLPLERVYAFEPVPEELTASEARHILGAQANVWTEYIPTEEYLEYMVFPRMFALAEVAWSQPSDRSFDGFVRRLPWHLRRLDALAVNYRVPDVVGLERDRLVLDDKAEITLSAPVDGEIRYSLGGGEAEGSSLPYQGPFQVKLDQGPVTVSAWVVLPDGRTGAVRKAEFRQATPRPAALMDTTTLEPGVTLEFMEGRVRTVERLRREEIVRREKVSEIGLPDWVPAEDFGLRFRGYLAVPEEGIYTVRLTSDDGSVLRMGNRVVADHDGPHGASVKEVEVALARGVHPFELLYFQIGGGMALSLEVVGPPSENGEIRLLRVR